MIQLLRTGQLDHTLTLLVNGEIDINLVTEDKESAGKKRNHKASTTTTAWKRQLPNGTAQPFSETLCGGATRKFMVALKAVPPNTMRMIIHTAREMAERQKAKASASASAAHAESSIGDQAVLAFR
jgi:hypothetical protein